MVWHIREGGVFGRRAIKSLAGVPRVSRPFPEGVPRIPGGRGANHVSVKNIIVWLSTVRYCMVWLWYDGMVWHGMTCYGTGRYGRAAQKVHRHS